MGQDKKKVKCNKKNNCKPDKCKKKIPCDDPCDKCVSPFPVTPLPDMSGTAAAGFYEASTGATIPPGGLVSFSLQGADFNNLGVVNLGGGRFMIPNGGFMEMNVVVPVGMAGGTLALAVGSQSVPLTPVPRTVIHNSGNFGTIQRSGVFDVPDGAIVGIMNVSPSNNLVIPALSPDGVQLYQSIQFTRLDDHQQLFNNQFGLQGY